MFSIFGVPLFVIHSLLHVHITIKLADTLFIDSLSLPPSQTQTRVNVRTNVWRKHKLTTSALRPAPVVADYLALRVHRRVILAFKH